MEKIMEDVTMEKYVAKALEGYEQNHAGISEAIAKMEEQLEQYKTHRAEMEEGIVEMKQLLGIENEPKFTVVSENAD
jgi:ribosome-associated translation inhibitor RaiA